MKVEPITKCKLMSKIYDTIKYAANNAGLYSYTAIIVIIFQMIETKY